MSKRQRETDTQGDINEDLQGLKQPSKRMTRKRVSVVPAGAEAVVPALSTVSAQKKEGIRNVVTIKKQTKKVAEDVTKKYKDKREKEAIVPVQQKADVVPAVSLPDTCTSNMIVDNLPIYNLFKSTPTEQLSILNTAVKILEQQISNTSSLSPTSDENCWQLRWI